MGDGVRHLSHRGGSLPLQTNKPRRDVHPRWVTEGKITEHDCCPWLRKAQLEGRQICVIGASVAAGQVCIEAYRSGFKPVLVLLMDQVEQAFKEEVAEMVKKLKGIRFRTGMLDCGFDVLSVNSRQVKLSLDSSLDCLGQARDVTVVIPRPEPSFRRIRVSWAQNDRVVTFTGPALVLGPVVHEEMLEKQYLRPRPPIVTPEETSDEPEPDAEDDVPGGELELGPRGEGTLRPRAPGVSPGLVVHHYLTQQELVFVRDPGFWEQRYDPDCLPYVTPTYARTMLVFSMQVVQVACIFLPYNLFDKPIFSVLRVACNVVYLFPGTVGCELWWLTFLGLEVPCHWVTPASLHLTVLCLLMVCPLMLVKFSGFILSDYAIGAMMVNVSVPLVVFYAHCKSTLKLTRWSLAWFFGALSTATGAWIMCLPTTLVYQYLLSKNGALASLYLSLAYFGLESGMVCLVEIAYEKAVIEPRMRNPCSLIGDTKFALSLALMGIHCVGEVARFGTLLCGAVAATDAGFLSNAALSMLTSLVMNTISRIGLMGKLLTRLPLIGWMFCPTSCWAIHNNARFTCGWARFFCVLGMMLGRGLLHWDWTISWAIEPGREGRWCWSGIVLLTVFLSVLQELAEDTITHWICKTSIPVPQSPAFKEVSRQRLEDPMSASRFHTRHFYIPSPDGEKDEFCPNLMNVRTFPVTIFLAMGSPATIVLMTILSVGVGSGNLFGFCKPLSMSEDSIDLFLRNVLVWTIDCDF